MDLRSGIGITVGSWTIKVHVVPNLSKDRDLYGEWDPDNRVILIAGDICPQDQAQTLLHELFHAASTYCHLELDEQDVVGLENFFAQIIKDYPALITVFLEYLSRPRAFYPHTPDSGGPHEPAKPDA